MHEARNRIPAAPVTLQLAIELGLADELTTRLLDPAQCGLVRGARGAADRIRNDIYLVTFLQCVERRDSQASFGPQGGHDQLPATGRLDSLLEHDIIPATYGGADVGGPVAVNFLDLRCRRFVGRRHATSRTSAEGRK